MTNVNFYHLQADPLSRALPRLLEKVYEQQMTALVRGRTEDCLIELDECLWSANPSSFLPHAIAQDDVEVASQPILLTLTPDQNLNNADVLVLVEDAESPDIGSFDRCLYMFDGNDETALDAARARWKLLKDEDVPVSYFQQTETGWQKKA
ncbi:DNA polymerase III subunit chi [Sneathiella marina]|uniref:DNA polymerase III subunit chi n=1 Tax=Sneathiella marina TaxID=2950108 RepID=A0ABY4W1K7_9PROT|nr:DNA polymerase III subunit chi [Sneathiella marina]USG59978.1 DNA polymerase III subunit chi [Sneathiella marina]